MCETVPKVRSQRSEVRSQKSEENGFGQFERDGFQIIESLAEFDECDLFATELTPLFAQQQNLSGSKIGGVRSLLHTNLSVSTFANSSKIISFLAKFVGLNLFPVRAIFFDKNPESNWLVPWHQDLTIAVAEKIEVPGFSGWSVKDGILHVHPPREILEGMFTLRLHLDDCDANNGALKVIPGSHLRGKLGATEISELVKSNGAVVCEVRKGGALLMRPLLLHASSPAKNPSHRRILHIEYATHKLPNGLKWFER